VPPFQCAVKGDSVQGACVVNVDFGEQRVGVHELVLELLAVQGDAQHAVHLLGGVDACIGCVFEHACVSSCA